MPFNNRNRSLPPILRRWSAPAYSEAETSYASAGTNYSYDPLDADSEQIEQRRCLMKFGLRTLAVMAAACVILVASTSSAHHQQNQQQQKQHTVKSQSSHRQHSLRFRPVPIVAIPLRIGGGGGGSGASNTKPSSFSSSLETKEGLAKGTQEFNNDISKDEQQKDNGPVGKQQTSAGKMLSDQPTVSSSSLFAGLLVDKQAFFFPMDMSSTLSESASAPTPALKSTSKQKKEHKLRRNLKSKKKHEKETDQPMGIVDNSAATSVWSWIVAGEASDGKVNKHKTKTKKKGEGKLDGEVMKSLAAVGPYYRTKSTILMDFYNETDWSNDGTSASTTSTGKDVSSDNSVSGETDGQLVAPSITADWKCDVERGTQIADAYKNIGLLIDAHYKDSVQKCSSCVDETNSDCADLSENGPCGIVWSEDSKRGLDIANQYKILGKTVADHYSALENTVNSSTIAEPTQSSSPFESCIVIPTGNGGNDDQATTSMYVSDGMIVADYYLKKAQLVEQYYNSSLIEFTPDAGSHAGTEAETGVATGLEQDPSLLRLLEQGEAIHQYYRASMDSASYQKDLSKQWDELLASDPDLIFPPWGFDWHTDREHGIAIGKYWHLRHKLEREQYTVQGQGLTDY
eukprot:CAMPEP_0113444462 /NCGR_PEP_ID=MMETSP0014_2-20120614/2678_1 /TAXON_ID=2857 /ORGANISM="Nitzschia sp." /LENGTH=627 /DNA_ID=CAMNT_0000335473 /DNA_START=192 /DNA_END=2072 /DNA_ORIENTATION=+ /assembly_acc=CAM_ASM_000159